MLNDIYIYIYTYQITAYERERLLQIQENKKKVDELGLKEIAHGLNLVTGKTVSNEKEEDDLHLDKEYVPEDDGLSEEEEEAENVKPKKDTKKKELKRKKGDKPPTNPARPRTRSTAPLTKV